MQSYWVYILCSNNRNVLYIGVTNNLVRRMQEHKQGLVPGFTQTYHVSNLIHAERYESVFSALQRERKLKRWNRAWKEQLIEQNNPEWQDLCNKFL
jgi:putative endonuclease